MDYTLTPAPLIQGLCVPMITVLDAQGRLDAASQERLVAFLAQGEADAGAQALFTNGTTGEWHHLDPQLRRQATETVQYALAGGRGPRLWAGVSDRTAGGVLQSLEHALKTGAAAAVIAPLAVEDIKEPMALFHRHISPLYQRLGKGLPLFLYDNPEAYRHGKQDRLRTREVKQLARLDYICGVKVTADARTAGNYLRGARNYKARHEFGVYLGKALQAFDLFTPSQGPLGNLRERWRRFWVAAEAPQGIVPGSGNLFPSAWRQAWAACTAGDLERMSDFEEAFTRLHKAFRHGGVNKVVACVKTALVEEGVIADAILAKGTPALSSAERSQWMLAYRSAKTELARLTRASQKLLPAPGTEIKAGASASAVPAVLGFGAAVVDSIIPVKNLLAADAKQKTAGPATRHAGGVILNQLAWTRALGQPAALGGGSGSGERAAYLRQEAQRLGVDTAYWLAMPGLDADEARIFVTPKGQRAIYLEAGASAAQGKDQVAALRLPLARASFLLTEISLLPLASVVSALELAQEQGKESFLDLDVPPGLATGGQGLGTQAELDRCLRLSTHLKASAEAAKELVSGATLPKLAAALHRKYKKPKGAWVCITDGARGAYGFDGNKAFKTTAFKVKAVDTTGCGDAFHAGLLVARAAGLDLGAALKLGAAAGAVAATHPGAVPAEGARQAVEAFYGPLPLPVLGPPEVAAGEAVEHWRVALSELQALCSAQDAASLESAKSLILGAEAQGHRLHVTGVGKCEYVAGFIASSFSSTGTPAFFLHATEAAHGASGQVKAGDVVIAISNSGETDELKAAVSTLKKNGAKVLGVSGKPGSWLARHSDSFLWAGVRREGDALNLAPRASVLAEILVLNGLGVALQHHKKFTAEQFKAFHPGGSLGKDEG